MIIYKATNIVNGRCYIGQTIKSLDFRKDKHLYSLRSYKTYFANALRKYGWDNFTWDTLCKCDNKEELDEMEFHYIKQYNSYMRDDGYNMTLGGDGGAEAGRLGNIVTWDRTRKSFARGQKNRSIAQKKRFSDPSEIERYKTISLVPKCYLLVYPDGAEYIIENLAKYARDNWGDTGYTSIIGFLSCLRKVDKGIMKSAKGYWCKLIQ
jgi:hypothetical protein